MIGSNQEEMNTNDPQTLQWALDQTGGKRSAAAELLGISRTSMWRRMKEMKL